MVIKVLDKEEIWLCKNMLEFDGRVAKLGSHFEW